MAIRLTAVIPTGELQQMVTEAIRDQIGDAALYCDNFQFIACMFNEILCDAKALDPQLHVDFFEYNDRLGTPEWIEEGLTADEILTAYNIPIDVVWPICARVKHFIEDLINYALGGIEYNRHYTFRLNLSGDIVLNEHEHTPVMTNSPSPEETMIQSIQQGIDNGDWYPEQLRRLAGRH